MFDTLPTAQAALAWDWPRFAPYFDNLRDRPLALGGTRPLPELFSAAGAKFAFDTATVREAVELIERTLDQLEAV